MRILRYFCRLLICILCICFISNYSYGASNMPLGDVTEYGNWINAENMEKFNAAVSSDMDKFQSGFQQNLESDTFVPIEAQIGFAFMKALSSIDYVLQISLVRFTIMFLFIMYAFWIASEAYKMIRETSDYKKVFFEIFKKGFIIAIWVLILYYGPAKIFVMLINPILALGTGLSDFILNTTAEMFNIDIPNTCSAIHDYVNQNAVTGIANGENAALIVPPETAANIMCLPARVSVYFYKATGMAWKWTLGGFTHSATQIVAGGVCVVLFIKCIFKYAFMTLGVVADLFLTLLMLPFTAIAEALPSTDEKGYMGQILSGFLKIFNTKKLSDIIGVFINAAIYFVSLAIVISICAGLLSNFIDLGDSNEYMTGRAMITILCGGLILYLANKADALAKQIGGSIDNSFGEKLFNDTKTLWDDTKSAAGKIYKNWKNKK